MSLLGSLRMAQPAEQKNVVAELMGAHGIAPERLMAEGAATVPSTDSNNAENGTNRNRRVELVVQ
jgi:flagellar motor protein MotB